MRPIFAAILAVWLSVQGTVAFALDAIETVIADQLEAFNARDLPKAFGYASPMIKRLFGGSDSFAVMVERSYPMIWDNADARFLDLREEDGAYFQRILIQGEDGVSYIFDYKMIETEQGWLIDGVAPVLAPDVAA